MISTLLAEAARKDSKRTFVVDALGALSYGEALRWANAMAESFASLAVERVYFRAGDSTRLIVALIAADILGIDACVINERLTEQEVEDVVGRVGQGHIFTDVYKEGQPGEDVRLLQDLAELPSQAVIGRSRDLLERSSSTSEGKVVILTTGTTGTPKAALYTWDRLVAQGRVIPDETNATWLLVYPLSHFAGIQLLVHVLLNGDRMVIPESRGFDHVLGAMRSHQVDSASATPTFWRLFTGKIKEGQARDLSLKQITVGGEASTPEVLARLRALFPNASISQVYATTELGSCFSVRDGLPGFPTSYLQRPVGNVDLKIVDGELYVKAENSMLGYLGGSEESGGEGGWMASGDLVEVIGDRVQFRGRRSETINVGGVKVHPLRVEEVVFQVEGVDIVRAYARPNAVTGQVVAIEVELSSGADTSNIVGAIRDACRSQLNRYEQPCDIKVVDSVARRNEKVVRRVGSG